MPIRNFVYATVEDLTKKIIPNLEKARATGSLEFISAAGIVSKRGALTPQALETLYYQARYEIYLFGQGFMGKTANSQCKILEPCDPWKEKVMNVGVNRGYLNGTRWGYF